MDAEVRKNLDLFDAEVTKVLGDDDYGHDEWQVPECKYTPNKLKVIEASNDEPKDSKYYQACVIAYLMCQGEGNKGIAARIGCGEEEVAVIKKQPIVRRLVAVELEKQGLDVAQELFNGELLDSVYSLVDMRDNAKSETVKLKAATYLVDRILGRVPPDIDKEPPGPANAEEAKKELEKIQHEIKVYEGGYRDED